MAPPPRRFLRSSPSSGACIPTASPTPFSFLLIALIAVGLFASTSGFPILAEVEEDSSKCFRFNIPEDDDAHMVFIALPTDVDDEVEDWFVTNMHEMTRKGSDNFMKALPQVSQVIHEKMGQDRFQGKSNVYLKVQKPRRPVLRHQMFMWYAPVIMMNIVKSSQRGGHGWEQPLGGYSICFENSSDDEAKIVFDVVLLSDEGEVDEGDKKKVIKKEHLTPLESNFEEGIKAASTILNEMHYMEKREARMRHTADSTNSRIRYFSYLSIAVLLGVTSMQITYLKGYFKKKKLM